MTYEEALELQLGDEVITNSFDSHYQLEKGRIGKVVGIDTIYIGRIGVLVYLKDYPHSVFDIYGEGYITTGFTFFEDTIDLLKSKPWSYERDY
jgi:hypothetical protein